MSGHKSQYRYDIEQLNLHCAAVEDFRISSEQVGRTTIYRVPTSLIL